MKAYQRLESLPAFILGAWLAVCLVITNTCPSWAQTKPGQQRQKQAHSRPSAAGRGGKAPLARPNANTALLARGAALHKEGKVEEAEAIFREVLAHDPRCVDAFYDLGAIAEGRGDLIGALSSYRAALALRSGDKELQEAVTSTEAAIRKGAITIKHEEQKQAQKDPPLGANSQATLPVLQAQAAPPETSPDDQPIFSVPQAEAAPRGLDGKTFSLSSSKGAMLAPSVGVPLNQSDVPRLGITADQFPDPVALSSGTTAGVCPPPSPPALSVGQNHKNFNSGLRRGAGIMLTVGAGAVLGGALHCPICHMLRF